MHRAAVSLLVALLVVACGSTETPSPSPSSGPTTIPSGTPAATTRATPASPAATPAPTATPAPIVRALSLYPLPQLTDLFRGARIASMAGGRAGVVILGSDIATGALISWTSTDGDAWQRHWLPGSTFGGGSPERLVGGDFGYLAIGWRYSGTEFVDAAWFSKDGVTWGALPDDALPSGLVASAVAGPAGIALAVVAPEGGTVIASSTDAGSWRTARLPGVVGGGNLVAQSDGFVLVGSIQSPDSNGTMVSRSMVWRSPDGLNWSGDLDLAAGIFDRPNSIERWTLSPYGTVGSDVSGGLAQIIGSGLVDLQPVPANGLVVGSPAGLLWVAGATLDGSCIAAWQWDGRAWRPLDNASARPTCVDQAGPVVLGDARLADGAVVYGLLGSDYQRVAWLVRPSGEAPTARPAGGPVAKAPTSSIPDPLTATFDHLSTCPPRPTSIEAMIALDPFLGAGCFGDQDLAFRAWVVDPGQGSGGTCPAFTPMWIYECVMPDYFFSAGAGINQGTEGSGMLQAMRSPSASGDLAGVGRWVQVTGHYNDPVSPSCRYGASEGATIGFEPMRPTAEAVLQCRKVFVVSHLRTIAAP